MKANNYINNCEEFVGMSSIDTQMFFLKGIQIYCAEILGVAKF